jgi:hypothetical protein
MSGSIATNSSDGRHVCFAPDSGHQSDRTQRREVPLPDITMGTPKRRVPGADIRRLLGRPGTMLLAETIGGLQAEFVVDARADNALVEFYSDVRN